MDTPLLFWKVNTVFLNSAKLQHLNPVRYQSVLLFSLIFSLGNAPVVQSFKGYELALQGSDESIAMTPVPGGSFVIGNPNIPEEAHGGEVTISDFWMGTYEVTWDQFELFLYREIDQQQQQSGPIDLQVDAVSRATMPYVNFNKPGLPAICMTQYAASQFCKWLTAITGDFYRLPTEAEWEYACRAGGEATPPGELSAFAWYAANSEGKLQTGGRKKPNPLGLYDMYGNATEWVLDSYKPGYAHLNDTRDPLHLVATLYPHVVRGGSFKSKADDLRPTFRDFSKASWKRQDPQFPKSLWWHTDATHVGFRIVRPVNVPEPEEMEQYWVQPIEEY